MTKLKKIISVIALMMAIKAHSMDLTQCLKSEVNRIKTSANITMSESDFETDELVVYDVMGQSLVNVGLLAIDGYTKSESFELNEKRAEKLMNAVLIYCDEFMMTCAYITETELRGKNQD